ncbi:MAG TPA: YceI family protein [Gammaproteobacteria bacterium]|nr:YceI family protein [Gammaproteobacteria bacterium]|tara:strand:- start:128 stop:709 length:582 start_codon:yes stop_codon:yes gene_type:complete
MSLSASRRLNLLGAALIASLIGNNSWAADYTVDLSHAFIQFRISHLGYSVLAGRFNDFSGEFSWDKETPEGATITVNIKTASIDTNWAERDKHLREPDFLDVERFPKATFRTTEYAGDASGGKLDGELTLHGVTKPITLDVKAIGEGDDPWGGYRAGFRATTTIDRTDFGISRDLGPTANTMDFDLFIEGIRK